MLIFTFIHYTYSPWIHSSPSYFTILRPSVWENFEISVSTYILLSENRITFYLKVTTEKEGQDPKCYKTTAGILVPQTLAGVKEIINKRGQALVGEMQQ